MMSARNRMNVSLAESLSLVAESCGFTARGGRRIRERGLSLCRWTATVAPVALVLIACGGPAPGTAKQVSQQLSREKEVVHEDAYHRYLEALIKEFETSYGYAASYDDFTHMLAVAPKYNGLPTTAFLPEIYFKHPEVQQAAVAIYRDLEALYASLDMDLPSPSGAAAWVAIRGTATDAGDAAAIDEAVLLAAGKKSASEDD